MSSPIPSTARLGASFALSCALTAAACTARLGPSPDGTGGNAANGGDPTKASGFAGEGGPGSSADASAGSPCSRTGAEVRLDTGASTDSFAFLWDTDHYVVVYSDPSQGNGDIYSILVNADGSVRGAATAVDPTPAASVLPTLVAGPDGYLVAWEEGSAGQAVYSHALDKNGQPVGAGVTVASTSAAEARPVLGVAPGGFVVAWMDDVAGVPAVYIAELDGSLRVSGTQRIDTDADAASFPWVAGDAQGAAIAWSDVRGQETDIRFADVGPAFTLENDGALRSGVAGSAVLPRMIRAGVDYVAAWEDMRASDNQIFMALTDASGGSVASGLVEEPDSGDANWPNMAWTGSTIATVFYQFRDSSPQIFLTLIDGVGNRVGAHDLQVSSTPSGSRSRFPDVQWTGNELGVIWVDTRDGQPELYFARVVCASPPRT